ncbi:uncharacterized protein TNCV_3252221 [Trichonephila clavipes]|nr:uncharacterized protein TNCV_3252221 [Trichonephila clavipes]
MTTKKEPMAYWLLSSYDVIFGKNKGGGQLDGWKWDCRRLMLLDVSMSRSVVQRLWDQYQSEDSVSEDLFRPTTSYNTCEDRFLALSARRKNHYCAAAHCRPLSSIRKKNLRYYGAKSSSQCKSVCKKNQLCAFPSTDGSEGTAYAGQENMFLGRSNNGLLCCSQTSQIYNGDYRGGGILVWAGISLGGHTDLHVFHGGTVTGLRYRDEILDPYVRPYAAAIGNDFILMDDNARPHRARIVEGVSGGSRFGTNGMASSISRPESIEHLWDYLGRGWLL